MTSRFKKGGFTLIETLVAVFILMTSVAAPLTVASRGLTAALITKNQITAFYLAQDALEYVRFARDTNCLLVNNSAGCGSSPTAEWLVGDGSANAIDLTSCTTATGCYLDSTSQNPVKPAACGAVCSMPFVSTSKYLTYTAANGFFNYASVGSGVTKTIFVRKVTLAQISTTEYLLTVNVYWIDLGVTHTVTVTENIFDWE
jgi:type II secretory pathway pseudopilin PulG